MSPLRIDQTNTPFALNQALSQLEMVLQQWAADPFRFTTFVDKAFGADASSPDADELRTLLLGPGLPIALSILQADQLKGLSAAYTASDHNGSERIYLNAAWLGTASQTLLQAVLLEEIGHAIDHRLNAGQDSPGDEGAIFSALIRGVEISAVETTQNDHYTLLINGQRIAVEADAPIASGSPSLAAVAEDSTDPAGDTVASLFASSFSDVDSDTLKAVAITANSADSSNQGDWQYSTDDGSNWTAIPTSGLSDASALYLTDSTLLRFLPVADFNGTPGDLTARLIDSSYKPSPSFSGSSSNPFNLTGVGSFASPVFADLDSDGDLDAFIGNDDGNTIYFRNTGTSLAPAFETSSSNPFNLSDVGGSAAPVFADLDSDGDLDAFIGNDDGNTIYFRNTGTSIDPAFAASSDNPFNLDNVGSFATPVFADLDSDGDLDAFISNGGGNTTYFENTGTSIDPAFAASSDNPFNLDNVGSFATPVFADLDSDGDLDAFIGNYRGNTIYFSNTGTSLAPAFAASSSNPFNLSDVGGGGYEAAPEFADLDGDGLLDAFIGNYDGNTIYFENTTTTNGGAIDVAANGGDTAVSATALTLSTSITAVSDAPIASGSPSLAAVAEDSTDPAGDTVASLFASSFSDVDSDTLKAVAITANSADSSNQGDWQYSTDDGSNWTAIPTSGLSDASALYLTDSTLLRFLPVSDFNGTPGDLTARLIDSSFDTSPSFYGGAIDVAANGGDTAVSATALTLSTSITAVSDAPIASGSPSLAAVAEDSTDPAGDTVASLFASSFSDVDSDTLKAVAITANSADSSNQGDWQYSTDDGSNWTAIPTSGLSDASALYLTDSTLLRFLPVADFNGTPGDLTARLIDSSYKPSPSFSGSSSNPFNLTGVGSFASPVFADLDSDGDLDAFIGNDDGNTIYFRNTGTSLAPAFETSSSNPFNLSDVGGSAAPVFADLDSDGDLDAFIGNDDGNTIYFRNTGTSIDPAFAASSDNPFNLDNVGSFATPVFADLDSDGDLDAFISNGGGNTTYFENTGTSIDPAFAASSDNPFNLDNVGSFATPVFADLDSDGDLDAFIGNYRGNTIYFSNTGTSLAPAFAASSSNPFNLSDVGGGGYEAAPEFADLDGDGLLDAFIGNYDGNTIYFENTTTTNGGAIDVAANGGDTAVSATALTLSTSITAVNDDPTGSLTISGTPTEGQTLTADTSAINDVDGLTTFSYQWLRNGSAISGATSSTYTLIQADVDYPISVTATYTDEGGTEESLTSSPTADVVNVSDAPIASGSPSLAAVAEDSTDPAGDTVASLFASSFSDVDSDTLKAVAITANSADSSAQGDWQYSTDDGSTWTAIPTSGLSDASALYLTDSTLLRFLPVSDFNGTPGDLTARLIDSSFDTSPSFSGSSSNPFNLSDVGREAAPEFADLDGDGDLDAFIGNSYGNTIYFQNTGTSLAPAFAASSSNPFGLSDVGGYAAPEFADLDGDGDLDAFIGNLIGNTIYFENTGTSIDPAFAASSDNPFNLDDVGREAAPEFADLDGDGDLDAFIGNSYVNTIYFQNTGTSLAPAFAASSSNPFGLSDVGGYGAEPVLADLDGDGDLDAFIGNYDGNTIYFRNTGTSLAPAFAASSSNPFGLSDVGNYAAPVFADLDDDGDLDAFLGNGRGNTIYFENTTTTNGGAIDVAANGGDTPFSATALTLSTSITAVSDAPIASGSPSLAAVAEDSTDPAGDTVASLFASSFSDVDSDTLKAVAITANSADSSAQGDWQYSSDSGSTWTAIPTSGLSDASALYLTDSTLLRFLPVSDFNGTPGDLTARLIDSSFDTSPSFSGSSSNPFNLTGVGGYGASPVFADLDGDGDLDAFIGNSDGNTIYFQNTGTSTAPAFETSSSNPFNLSDVGGSAAPVFADLDSDGDLDAFIGNGRGNTIYFENTGTSIDPAFAASSDNPFNLDDVGIEAAPEFADLDSDGDLDAFIGNSYGNTIYFENTGTSLAPAFASSSSNPFGLSDVGSYAAPVFADLDDDGDLDAFIGNYDGNTIYFRNTGTSTAPAFETSSSNPFGLSDVGYYAAPVFADLDDDGDLDAFIGNYDRNTIYFQNTTTTNGGAIDVAANGGDTSVSATALTLSTSITAVSDAPIASGSPSLAAVAEDSTDPAGDTVASLFASSFSDVDSDTLKAVAITANSADSSAQGDWQYSTDSGSTWTAIPTSSLSDSNALYLTDSTLLRFLPVSDFNGTPGDLTARLIDSSFDTSPSFSGSSSNPFNLTGVGGYAAPVFADLDSDGDLDAFIGNIGANTIYFQNTGTSTAPAFETSSSNPFNLTNVEYAEAAPEFADLDSDGDLDAFIGNHFGNTIFFQNTGTSIDPAFATYSEGPFNLTTVGYTAAPEFADIDNDGDLDAFIGNGDGNTIYFQNTGTSLAPVFASSSSNPFGLSDVGMFAAPVFADLDDDGDLDAFIGNSAGNTIYFQNSGTSTAPAFAASSSNPFNLSDVGGSAAPEFADLDGDGLLDAFLGNGRGNTIYFQNTTTTNGGAIDVAANGGDTSVSATALTLSTSITAVSDAPIASGSPSLAAVAEDSTDPAGDTVASLFASSFSDVDSDTLKAVAITANSADSSNQGDWQYSTDDGSNWTAIPTSSLSDSNALYLTDSTLLRFLPVSDFNGTPGDLTARLIDSSFDTSPSFSGSSSNPFNLTGVGGYGASPVFADLDGDGDLDAFIGNSDGNTIYFQNTGTSTAPAFAASSSNPFNLSDVGGEAAPEFADLDSDGDLDAFIGNGRCNTIYFENTGTSTAPAFAASSDDPFNLDDVGTYEASPDFADLDADGDLDAFIGNGSGNTIYFENTGTSTAPAFASSSSNPFGLSDVGIYAAPEFADLDDDGDLDAFIGNYDGNTIYFRNTGTSSAPAFAASSSNPFGLSDVGYSAAPDFADLDGDGLLDAFIGNYDRNTIYFQNTTTTTTNGGAIDVAANGGDTAVSATALTLSTSITAVSDAPIASGSPSLAAVAEDSTDPAGDTVASLFASSFSDVDSDTLKAVAITANSADSSAQGDWQYSTDSGSTWTAIPTSSLSDSNALYLTDSTLLRFLPVADFNGTPGDLTARLIDSSYNPSPSFSGSSSNPFNLTGVGGYGASPVFADLDGDGDLDAFIGNSDGNTIYFQNTGTSTAPAFAASSSNPFNLSDVGGEAAPEFADLDSDGDLDAFIGNGRCNTIYFENTGTSTAPAFAASSDDPFNLDDVGTYEASPDFADLDADGDLDAFIGNGSGNTIYFENTGTSTAPAFAASSSNPFNLSDVGIYAAPEFADLDDDGDLDAFIGNYDGNTIYFRNTGTSSAPAFAASSSNPFGLSDVGYSAAPDFADLDGDGLLDAFIGNYDRNTIYFQNTTTTTTNGGAIDVAANGGDTAVSATALTLSTSITAVSDAPIASGSPSLAAVAEDSTDPAGDTVASLFASSFSDVDSDTLKAVAITANSADSSAQGDWQYSSDSGSTWTAIPTSGLSDASALYLTDSTLLRFLPVSDFNGTPGDLTARLIDSSYNPSPSFSGSSSNPFNLTGVGGYGASPVFADLDGDGDLDAFIGNSDGNTIYFQNTGTSTAPAFAASSSNPFNLSDVGGEAAPELADLDSDGDLDAFIGNHFGNTIFFQNTGTSLAPAFAASSDNPFNLDDVGSEASPEFADLDSDGDLDAFIGNSYGNTIYFSNTGTSLAPAFAASSSNPFNLSDVDFEAAPEFADLDGDGLLDAFIGNYDGNTIYFRNTGTSLAPAFETSSSNPFNLSDVGSIASPEFADLDGDGLLDAFIGNYDRNTIYFQNTTTTNGGAIDVAANGGDTAVSATALTLSTSITAVDDLNLSIDGTSTSAALSSYSNQDIDSDAVLSNDDDTLTLTGNTWTKADLATGSSPNGYTITNDTVLSFSFDSSSEGEIQGIGFDNDDEISSDKTFQLAGTQSWGLQDFNNSYVTGSGQQTYTIPVGEFFTGDFQYLTFLNDDDTPDNPLATDSFSNISLFEDSLSNLNLSIDGTSTSAALSSYSNQDIDSDAVLSNDDDTLTLTGNTWTKADLATGSSPNGYTITNDTVLSFSFDSSSEGEIQGIGFDNDDEISSDKTFQLAGTQSWGLQDFNNSYVTGSGQQTYTIPVGEFFTGDFQYLTFLNDDDTPDNPLATDSFSNISLFEDSLSNLNLSIDGTSTSAALSSYSSQDIDSDAVLSNDDDTLTLTGNTWTKADLLTGSSPNGYTITNDTVLSFSFDSSSEGEIQGIGFDNDDEISSDKTFQLAGTQSWGLQDFNNSYVTGSGQQTYTIPVGEFFTGDFQYLTFLNDDDTPDNPLATDSFSNISLFEDSLSNLNLSIDGTSTSAALSSYSNQDIDSDAVLSNDDDTLTLTGNTWTKADLATGSSPNGYTITNDTVLSFSFDSSSEGEIQGIGFDNDDEISSDKTFQLAGTQSWGLQDFNNSYVTGSGQQTYTIPVGEFFTGDFQYLTFLNDDDTPDNPLATDSFSNIQLFENVL